MTYTQPYIMLIDDDEDDLELASSSLHELGLSTRCFDSGQHALQFLTGLKPGEALPELIILDYNMPSQNGHSILLMLKEDPALRDIPVLIYSTSLSPKQRDGFKENGAHDCLVKACTWQEHTLQMEQVCNLFHTLRNMNRKAV